MSYTGSPVSENPVCQKLGCRELRLAEAQPASVLCSISVLCRVCLHRTKRASYPRGPLGEWSGSYQITSAMPEAVTLKTPYSASASSIHPCSSRCLAIVLKCSASSMFACCITCSWTTYAPGIPLASTTTASKTLRAVSHGGVRLSSSFTKSLIGGGGRLSTSRGSRHVASADKESDRQYKH